MFLNSNAAKSGTDAGWFNSTLPSSSVITLGNYGDANAATTMIAYAFHSVEGFSSASTYKGNGTNNDGPFVYTGFRPSYILIKDIDAAEDWLIYDDKRPGYNVTDDSLEANDNAAENANGAIELDMLSNGFKIREDSADGRVNRNDDTYLYLAFAESPFKTANAR
jgi:hypothetical protein